MARRRRLKKPRIFMLKVTTWSGIALGATHYYGRITDETRKTDVNVERVLNEVEAAELTQKDGKESSIFRWKAGDTTGRFDSAESVEAAALKWFRERCSSRDVLFGDENAILNPSRTLAGPAWFRKKAAVLYSSARDNDFWDGNESQMGKISDRWDKLIGSLRKRG